MNTHILYSRKYWQELNLAVESQIAITKFGGSVQDRHRYYMRGKILADLIWQLEDRPPNRQI